MIGIGIIGAGFFAEVHANALASLPGARLVAVSRRSPEALAHFANAHGGRQYRDWRDLLVDRSVDAVLIATPHDAHTEIAIAALQCGKHVLVEKPMAHTIEDCDRINQAATDTDRQIMIGHVMHFFQPCMTARQMIEAGDFGRPVVGTSSFAKFWMEENRQPWHFDPSRGGGMLMTAGIHALDRLMFLMGGEVASVNAMTGTFFHQQDADDTAFIGLRFKDGRVGEVSSIGFRNGATSSLLDLVCEDAVISIDFNGDMRIGRNGQWSTVQLEPQPDPALAAVQRQWSAFLQSIRDETPTPVSGRYGRHVVAVIEAALQSNQARKEIQIEDAQSDR